MNAVDTHDDNSILHLAVLNGAPVELIQTLLGLGGRVAANTCGRSSGASGCVRGLYVTARDRNGKGPIGTEPNENGFPITPLIFT